MFQSTSFFEVNDSAQVNDVVIKSVLYLAGHDIKLIQQQPDLLRTFKFKTRETAALSKLQSLELEKKKASCEASDDHHHKSHEDGHNQNYEQVPILLNEAD